MGSKSFRKKKVRYKPHISVVIPCFNARETIVRTLKAVRNQIIEFPFEVIVIDSSHDGTTDIIRSQFPEVRLFHLDRRTLPGSGRNLGIQNAQGEIIVFTDSDCVPDPDWLFQIVSQYNRREVDGVGGCVINGYPKSLTAWASHLIEFNEWTESTREGYVKNIPSCNISFRREVFGKYKIYFTDIFPSEDTLFNWTLIEKGGKIYFDPRIRVTHLSRVGFRRLLEHQKTLGKASAEARRVSTLPGKIFTRYPILCLGLPFVRWIRATIRLFKKDWKALILFWLITPIYLIATLAWTIGFLTPGDFSDPRFIVEEVI